MKSTIIKRMAIEECKFNRPTRAKMLDALSYILQESEDPANSKVYHTSTEDIGHGSRMKGIIIQDIGALCGMTQELGGDFIPEYTLRGMQTATQDEDGYCMSVLTTHDLYSAEIPDIGELIYRIRQIAN